MTLVILLIRCLYFLGSQDDTGAIVFTRTKEHIRIETDRFISTYW